MTVAHKKVRLLLNGEPVTPESIMDDYRMGHTEVIKELTTGTWIEEEHDATLHIEYGESWSYDVDVYDLSDDVDWRRVRDEDIYVKWSWCAISYDVLGVSHNYDFDFPGFEPPRRLDYKRPSNWKITHSTYRTELSMSDLFDDWDTWGDVEDLVDFHTDRDYEDMDTLDSLDD